MLNFFKNYGLFVFQILIFFVTSVYIFNNNVGYLFPGGDGSYLLHQIENQAIWLPWTSSVSIDHLQSISNINFPINTKFITAFSLPHLLFGSGSTTTPIFQIISQALFSTELFLSVYLFSYVAGFNRAVRVTASWLAPMLVLPYWNLPVLYPLFLFAPQAATLSMDMLIIMSMAILATDNRPVIKRLSIFHLSLVVAIFMTHAVIINSAGVVLLVPILMVFITIFVFGSKASYSKRHLIAITSLFLVSLYLAYYEYETLNFSVSQFFVDELASDRKSLNFISSWYSSNLSRWIFIASFYGMLLSVFCEKRTIKLTVLFSIIFYASIHGVGLYNLQSETYKGPSPVYFEIMAFFVLAIFTSYAFVKTINLGYLLITVFIKRVSSLETIFKPFVSHMLVFLGIAASCLSAYASTFAKNPIRVWGPTPPFENSIISELRTRIGISPGAEFKGRVATLLLSSKSDSIGWMDHVVENNKRIKLYGNDFYWSGLWPFQIPTLFEYNPLMSPYFYYGATRMLGRINDVQTRNVVTLRTIDPHALEFFGVRYVLSDTKLEYPFHLISSQPGPNAIYLYEMKANNTLFYSPTRIIYIGGLSVALKLMQSPNFNFNQVGLTESKGSLSLFKNLSSAEDISVKLIQGGFRLSAKSAGDSVIVLPFAFSNCLKIQPGLENKDNPKLFRINSIMTGISFHSKIDVDILYKYGLISGSGCRRMDRHDFVSSLKSND